MFRLTRVFLVLLGAIATALAIVVLIGLRPYEASLRQQLQRDATARLLDFLDAERLDALERIQAIRLIAAEPEVLATFGRAQEAGLPDAGELSIEAQFNAALDQARTSIRVTAGRETDLLAVFDYHRRELARLEADGSPALQGVAEPESALSELPEVESALARGVATDGLLLQDDHAYWTAAAPVVDRWGQVVGAVLLAERVDAEALRGRLSRVGADGVLFRGGVVLATTLESGPVLDAADRLLISVAANPGAHYGQDGMPLQVSVTEGDAFLVALAPARLRRNLDPNPLDVGFMAVISAPRPPQTLPQLLWEGAWIDPEARPVWVTAAVGLVVILSGLLLVQRDRAGPRQNSCLPTRRWRAKRSRRRWGGKRRVTWRWSRMAATRP